MPGGPLAPPDFPRFSIVVVLRDAQAAQGLLALAPPEFCTFRRPCMYYVGEHSQIMNATLIDFLTIQTLAKKAISKILSQN